MPASRERIAELGAKRRRLREELDAVNAELSALAVEAVADGVEKQYVAADAGVTRRALDMWIDRSTSS